MVACQRQEVPGWYALRGKTRMERVAANPARHGLPHVLRGRGGECATLDGLLEGVRGGRSAALVVYGEAGVGKTALLRYAVLEGGAWCGRRARWRGGGEGGAVSRGGGAGGGSRERVLPSPALHLVGEP